MSKRVAVEEGLSPINKYLQENGYEVVGLNASAQLDDYDCCVISGVDENVMGMQDIVTNVPVIDARGMSPEEVYEAVNQRIGL